MMMKLTELQGCVVTEFADLKRFTLAVTEDVNLSFRKKVPV